MSDENTNPIVGTQTSQNDQATTNQTWNDFVLDFWEWEHGWNSESPEAEPNNLEDIEKEDNEEMVSTDIDLNDTNLFNEEDSKSEENQNDIKIEDEKENEWIVNDDFSISLDDNSSQENKENENEPEQESTDGDYPFEGKLDSDDSTTADQEINLKNEEDSWDEFLLDDDENGDDDNVDDNEEKDDENINFNDDEQEDKIQDTDESYESLFTLEDDQDTEDNENYDEESKHNTEKKVYDENEFSFDFQEDSSDNNEKEVREEQKNDDMYLWNVESESVENSVIDDESTKNKKSLNQPEIWDLLWDAPVDFPEESKDDAEIQDLEPNNESTNPQEDINSTPENLEEDTHDQSKKDNNIINNTEDEKQSFTFSSDNAVSEIYNKDTDWNINNQTQEESSTNSENQTNETNQANLVNMVSNSISDENPNAKVQDLEPENTNSLQESTDWIVWQQIKSTLSLDQILDSELRNNPQLTDNSKAVPTNVSENWSNKKIIWIITCVWLFVLVGVVAVLAFPTKKGQESTDEDTTTQIVEEYWIDDQSHQSPTQPEEETIWQDVTSLHTGNPTIQQDFPEVETEDEGDIWVETEEQDSWEPAPYNCEWNECFEDEVTAEKEENKLDIETIESEISSFKLQAEGYYSKWDELQDKKLIRYAAQAISLCESYQEQIKNGEWIDEESFESFKSTVKSIISKMEAYLGWDTDIQTFTKSNFDEEYDFPWKQEHKEFIYEMANS